MRYGLMACCLDLLEEVGEAGMAGLVPLFPVQVLRQELAVLPPQRVEPMGKRAGVVPAVVIVNKAHVLALGLTTGPNWKED